MNNNCVSNGQLRDSTESIQILNVYDATKCNCFPIPPSTYDEATYYS